MSRRLVFGLPPAVYVIDVSRKRPSVDVVAMVIAGSVLLFWLGIAVLRFVYPEAIQ